MVNEQYLNFGSSKSCSKNSNESANDAKKTEQQVLLSCFAFATQYDQNLIYLPNWILLAIAMKANVQSSTILVFLLEI